MRDRTRAAKSYLPDAVAKYRQAQLTPPIGELADIVTKLTADTPEIGAMWHALERRQLAGYWIQEFVRSVSSALAESRFAQLDGSERRLVAKRISRLSRGLVRALRSNELDVHVLHSTGKLFKGFMFFEEFGESNRQRILDSGEDLIELTVLIEGATLRAVREIRERGNVGKAGRNAPAVRFMRLLSERRRSVGLPPLNGVVATATNAIFGTQYAPKDVVTSVRRRPRNELPQSQS